MVEVCWSLCGKARTQSWENDDADGKLGEGKEERIAMLLTVEMR